MVVLLYTGCGNVLAIPEHPTTSRRRESQKNSTNCAPCVKSYFLSAILLNTQSDSIGILLKVSRVSVFARK